MAVPSLIVSHHNSHSHSSTLTVTVFAYGSVQSDSQSSLITSGVVGNCFLWERLHDIM